jgi:hypothetical protein
MSTFRILAAIVSALFVGAVHAQTSTAKPSDDKTPLTQGISSVDKNLEKKPDNKGLQNADKRLRANRDRIEARRVERDNDRAERAERPERHERAERAERPERTERSGR